MAFIRLDRPLAVFDIEATGLNPRTDRIVELSVVRVPVGGGEPETRTWLLDPTVPIPIETTAIHGICDDMVKGCPTFADKADEILAFFRGCDLGGFGIGHLDVPILEEEFARVGKFFNAGARRQFDALRIYHKREPRDLTAALKFFCGETYEDAHGAEPDALAALRVLRGEFARYPDLPADPDALDRYLNERDPFALDRDARLRWLDGEVAVNFGKKKGAKLRDLAQGDPGFLRWILHADFGRDVKEIVRDALAGKFPKPPPVTPSSAPARLPQAGGPAAAAGPRSG